MYKKLALLFLVSVISLQGAYLSKKDIDKNKKVLQLSSCFNKECVIKVSTILRDEPFYIIKSKDIFIFYIVNIENNKKIDKLKQKYKYIFPDAITKRKLIKEKNILALSNINIEGFNNHKNKKVKSKTNILKIYDKPSLKARQSFWQIENRTFNILGCKDEAWCKLNSNKEFIPFNNIKIVKDTKKEKTTTNKSLFKYKQALTLFKDKKYKQAYKLLNELYERNLNEPNINFYLGRSAFELKEYNNALLAYERVLFARPDSTRVKFEIARTNFESKNYKQAKKEFLELKKDKNLSANAQVTIDIYLAAIDEKISKHFFNGFIMLGIGYDSNLNTRSKHDTFNNTYFSTLGGYLDVTNTTEDASVWNNQQVVIATYTYKFNDHIKSKNDFLFYNKQIFDSNYNPNDIQLYNISPILNVSYSKNLEVDYGIFFDKMWYGGSYYLTTFGLYPKINYIYNNKSKISTYVKYQNKSYANKYDSKDSTYLEVSSSLNYNYLPKVILIPSFNLSKEKEKRSSQTEIDTNEFGLSLGLNYLYKPTLNFLTTLIYDQTLYDDSNSNYLVRQKNKNYKLNFSTTYVYSPKWIVQGSAAYTTQTSNMQTKEYNQHTFGLNIIRTF